MLLEPPVTIPSVTVPGENPAAVIPADGLPGNNPAATAVPGTGAGKVLSTPGQATGNGGFPDRLRELLKSTDDLVLWATIAITAVIPDLHKSINLDFLLRAVMHKRAFIPGEAETNIQTLKLDFELIHPSPALTTKVISESPDTLMSCKTVLSCIPAQILVLLADRADERKKLERLCRYHVQGCTSVAGGRKPGVTISRPAVSEKRLSLTPNGNIRYDVKGFISVAGAWMHRSDPAQDAVPGKPESLEGKR